MFHVPFNCISMKVTLLFFTGIDMIEEDFGGYLILLLSIYAFSLLFPYILLGHGEDGGCSISSSFGNRACIGDGGIKSG